MVIYLILRKKILGRYGKAAIIPPLGWCAAAISISSRISRRRTCGDIEKI
jgi:hypothetical protein